MLQNHKPQMMEREHQVLQTGLEGRRLRAYFGEITAEGRTVPGFAQVLMLDLRVVGLEYMLPVSRERLLAQHVYSFKG